MTSKLTRYTKKTLIGTLLGVTLVSSTLVTNAYADDDDNDNRVTPRIEFKDINASHHAYKAIVWAKNNDIVGGYNDGTFRPNSTLTEAQFVKMLVEYLDLDDAKGVVNKSSKHWADEYYNQLGSYSTPLNGYYDDAIRNQPVKRGVVAQAIGHLTGNATTLADSINFLIKNGITTGQNLQHQGTNVRKFFGVDNNLTRAQLATFLYRMDNADIDEAEGIAEIAYDNKEGLEFSELLRKGMHSTYTYLD